MLCFLFAHLWFALFSEFTPLTLVNSEKGYFCLDIIELAQCRSIGFTQIVTGVTSVGFTFFELHCAFGFILLLGFTAAFALFVRMCRGVSLLRERFSGAARPPKNPLASWAQMDQLMGALLLLCDAAAAAAIFGFARYSGASK